MTVGEGIPTTPRLIVSKLRVNEITGTNETTEANLPGGQCGTCIPQESRMDVLNDLGSACAKPQLCDGAAVP